jgi:predicted RND superfamily exporter protein
MISIVAGILVFVCSGLTFLLTPTINDYLKQRKKNSREKEIKRLQNRLDKLKNEL